MTAERWKRVKSVLASAVDRPEAERAAFVLEACGTDQTLRHEVELLLKAHEEAGGFLGGSAFEAVPRIASEETTGTQIENRRIGAYQLVRELGRGGMGTVYLAVRADDEFKRRVAIKLIKRGMDTDEIVQRFRQERQILADLDHAYIARLLDGGTTADGLPYFVMEYVEGEPIHSYCDHRKLAIRERLRLFMKVCSALEHAHAHHIIHRDVKPRNILVTAGGLPKLLDFGIAKMLDPGIGSDAVDLTLMPQRLMTPEYASPEQVTGRPVSAASDVYSLGVLLYLLLTGHRPYQLWNRRMDEVVRIICEQTPPLPSSMLQRSVMVPGDTPDPVSISSQAVCESRDAPYHDLRRQLEGALDHIVLKAMRKDPLERYSSANEFAADIKRYLEGEPIASDFYTGATRDTPIGPRTLAVLPFTVLRTEELGDEYLGIGLADALITKLTNIRRLTVRPTSSIVKYAGAVQDTIASGRELGVDYVLDGRMRRAGDRVRITVQLIRVHDGAPVWGAKLDENFTDMLALEDSISGLVASAIVPRLTGEEKDLLNKRETENPKAYELFLRGRYHASLSTEEDLAKALVFFMEAIALDPRYARAHAGVAEYYSWLGVWCVLPPSECFAATKASARTALEFDPTLADAYACRGFAIMALDWDWAGAEADLRKSIDLCPGCSDGQRGLAILLSVLGRHAEAIAHIETAQKADPLSAVIAATVGVIFLNARLPDRALQVLERALEMGENLMVYLAYGWAYLQKGLYAEAVSSARRAVVHSERNQHSLALLAHALSVSGDREEARKLLAELEDLAQHRYVSPYQLGLIRLSLGDRPGALDSFEQAAGAHDWWLIWLATEPRLQELRDEPRYHQLLTRIGLEFRLPAERTDTARTATTLTAPLAAGGPVYSRRKWLFAGSAAAALALAAGVRSLRNRTSGQQLFQSPRFVRLTSDGNAEAAAISPDGRYVAYTQNAAGNRSLWLRQVGISSGIQIVPPTPVEYRGLAFSRDSNYINYVVYTTNKVLSGTLYQVPVLGGAPPNKVADQVSGPISVSPDNRRRAFLRRTSDSMQDELIVLNGDGTNERTLASRRYPERFAYSSAPAWSPDGSLVACATENTDSKGFYISIYGFRINNGAATQICRSRWQSLDQMAWSAGGRSLLLVARDQDSTFQQLWHISYPDGALRKLTNDLNNYSGVSLSDDSSALVTVQKQTLSNVWISPMGDIAAAKPATLGGGRYFDLCWTPDGRIVYASDSSGNADIWIMQASGANQKLLTFAAHRNYAPAVSPDGKSIAFHSNRSGNWNIWRMDLDGGHPVQLTRDVNDSNWPRWSPDSRWIVYHHTGAKGFQTVWKVPAAGGAPVQVTDRFSFHPAYSPKDGTIACWYSDSQGKPDWRIAILPPDGGPPLKTFTFPASVSVDSALRWLPDGTALLYTDHRGVSNIWMQPVSGGAARPITAFTSEQIFAFDLSSDGRLAYSRGLTTSDVVLMTEDQAGRL